MKIARSIAVSLLALAFSLPAKAGEHGEHNMVTPRGGDFHEHHDFDRRGGFIIEAPYFYGNFGHRDCAWLRIKAEETNSQYWWDRYYGCKAD